MKLPETLQRVNAELHVRRQFGFSYRAVDISVAPVRDDVRGVFLRLTIHLEDGDSFDVDTFEASEMLRHVIGH
jgi:hypothetical protein